MSDEPEPVVPEPPVPEPDPVEPPLNFGEQIATRGEQDIEATHNTEKSE